MINKKSILLAVLFFICFTKIIEAQPKNKSLLFISDFPVKIDGGCSFYVDKKVSIDENKFQLIIDAHHRAFIEYKKGEYAFFNLIKREKSNNYYREYYKADKKSNYWYKARSGSFVLTIDSIMPYKDHQTLRTGTLKLIYPGLNQTIKIWGKVDLIDKYYNKLYPKN